MINPAKRGRMKEKQDVKSLGGIPQINSGTFWHSKGDFKINGFLVDSKSTLGAYIINEKGWDKLRKQAIKERCSPVFLVGVGDFDGVSKTHEYNIIVMDANEWAEVYRKRFAGRLSGDTKLMLNKLTVKGWIKDLEGSKLPVMEKQLGRFEVAVMELDTFKEWCLEGGEK